MIETKEREGLSAAWPTTTPQVEPQPRRRVRGWIAFAIAIMIAVAGVAIGLALTRPDAPVAADRPHSGFRHPVQTTGGDGSKVDLSDQAFRYGMVKLVDGSKVDLSDQAFRPLYQGAGAPEAPRLDENKLEFLLRHP